MDTASPDADITLYEQLKNFCTTKEEEKEWKDRFETGVNGMDMEKFTFKFQNFVEPREAALLVSRRTVNSLELQNKYLNKQVKMDSESNSTLRICKVEWYVGATYVVVLDDKTMLPIDASLHCKIKEIYNLGFSFEGYPDLSIERTLKYKKFDDNEKERKEKEEEEDSEEEDSDEEGSDEEDSDEEDSDEEEDDEEEDEEEAELQEESLSKRKRTDAKKSDRHKKKKKKK